jgi:hypothetical protein
MSTETLGLLIPFFAIGLGIATMITWLVLWHRHRLRDLEMRHAERMAAIQQGMEPPDMQAPPPPGAYPPPPPGAYPPPPGVYPPSPPPYDPYAPRPRRYRGQDPARYLLRGLVWLGIGLALSFGRGPWDSGLGQFGWIAVAVGVAYLIYYGVDHGRYNGPPPPPPGQGPPPGPGSGPDASWRNGPPPPPPQS